MEEKSKIRNEIWEKMEKLKVSKFPLPVKFRIPNFIGCEEAAKKLRKLDVYANANVVKVNPDSPQAPVREMVLRDGKTLVMPTPRIRQGFLVLDPKLIDPSMYRRASSIKGAFSLGKNVHPSRLPKIDLIVLGSVAVGYNGGRIGKGEGYGEIEYAVLRQLGKVDETTPIVTTVHDIQVLNNIPVEEHDVALDIIITPTKIIKVTNRPLRPKGIMWDKMTDKKIDEIPILHELKKNINAKNSCDN